MMTKALSSIHFSAAGRSSPGADVSEREIRRATAAYYGMVEGIDEDYGVVLAALEHVGQNLDDWIIIYTSDHGEMLGEHQLWEKTKFFEGSVKVPLIIRLPGGAKAGRAWWKKCQPVRPVRDDMRLDRCSRGRRVGQPQPGPLAQWRQFKLE